MFERLKSYSKGEKGNVTLGFSFQVLSMAVLFVKQIALIPLFLKAFPLSDFAGWLVIQGVTNWFYIFNPGFSDYYRQQLGSASAKKDSGRISALAQELMRFQFLLGLVIALAGALLWHTGFYGFIGLDLSSSYLVWAIVLSVVGVVLFALSEAFSACCIGLGDAKRPSAYGLIGNVIAVLVSLLFYRQFGVAALALGAVCFSGTLLVLNYRLNRRMMRSYRELKAPLSSVSFKFSRDMWMTFLGRIAKIAVLSTDDVFLMKFFSDGTVVSYGLLKKILMFIGSLSHRMSNLLIAPIANYLSRNSDDKIAEMERKLSSFGLAVGAFTVSFGFFLSSQIIELWVGEAFLLSSNDTALISIYYACTTLVTWELYLRFSKGMFMQFFGVFATYGIFIISLRYLGGYFEDIYMFYAGQTLCSILAGLYVFATSPIFYSKREII
jgi:O-antigen/teichoic acid export membrane protein